MQTPNFIVKPFEHATRYGLLTFMDKEITYCRHSGYMCISDIFKTYKTKNGTLKQFKDWKSWNADKIKSVLKHVNKKDSKSLFNNDLFFQNNGKCDTFDYKQSTTREKARELSENTDFTKNETMQKIRGTYAHIRLVMRAMECIDDKNIYKFQDIVLQYTSNLNLDQSLIDGIISAEDYNAYKNNNNDLDVQLQANITNKTVDEVIYDKEYVKKILKENKQLKKELEQKNNELEQKNIIIKQKDKDGKQKDSIIEEHEEDFKKTDSVIKQSIINNAKAIRELSETHDLKMKHEETQQLNLNVDLQKEKSHQMNLNIELEHEKTKQLQLQYNMMMITKNMNV